MTGVAPAKPKLAVWKFASCDGCQLSLLDCEDELLAVARSASALAVGESDGFATRGGVINFFTEDRKLRFEINPEAARSAGLKISSRLLRLAVLVGQED